MVSSPAGYQLGEWNSILLETSGSRVELATLSHPTQEARELGCLYVSSCNWLWRAGSKMGSSSKRKVSGEALQGLAVPLRLQACTEMARGQGRGTGRACCCAACVSPSPKDETRNKVNKSKNSHDHAHCLVWNQG